MADNKEYMTRQEELGTIQVSEDVIAAIATPIAKSQQAREVWFYVMSGGALLKIAVMEIARIVG